jgi:type IV pilus assembly protein PilQ
MKKYTLILLFLLPLLASGQKIVTLDADSLRLVQVRAKLDAVAEADPVYGEQVDISVGKMSLADLLRNVAKVGNVNLSVKGAENIQVTVNFSRAKITDLVYFLCKEYGLDIDVVGNIIAIRPLPAPPVPPRIPKVSFAVGRGLSYDLSGERLIDVVKRITELTGTNIVVAQGLYARQISGYVSDMPLDEGIATLAGVNGLEAQKAKNGVWELLDTPAAPPGAPGQPGSAPRSPSAYTRTSAFAANQLSVDSLGLITAQISRGNINDIVTDLCEKQGLNYFFVAPLAGQTSVWEIGRAHV